jgi:hypothetical protein
VLGSSLNILPHDFLKMSNVTLSRSVLVNKNAVGKWGEKVKPREAAQSDSHDDGCIGRHFGLRSIRDAKEVSDSVMSGRQK